MYDGATQIIQKKKQKTDIKRDDEKLMCTLSMYVVEKLNCSVGAAIKINFRIEYTYEMNTHERIHNER